MFRAKRAPGAQRQHTRCLHLPTGAITLCSTAAGARSWNALGDIASSGQNRRPSGRAHSHRKPGMPQTASFREKKQRTGEEGGGNSGID